MSTSWPRWRLGGWTRLSAARGAPAPCRPSTLPSAPACRAYIAMGDGGGVNISVVCVHAGDAIARVCDSECVATNPAPW
eukprot:5393446-Pleurochrysis_carterae.AAC.1